jgi:hypothetical protein
MRSRAARQFLTSQADIDAWYATATDPGPTRSFLKWAAASRKCPPSTSPVGTAVSGPRSLRAVVSP